MDYSTEVEVNDLNGNLDIPANVTGALGMSDSSSSLHVILQRLQEHKGCLYRASSPSFPVCCPKLPYRL